jgi:tRNA(Ile)-lysidine synthase
VATFTPESLHEILRRLMPSGVSRISVAYSGGLDSSVLLVALARIRDRLGAKLRALHVDHQLQSASGEWVAHCARTAAHLNIPFAHLRVEVDDQHAGVEAGARAARYAAFRRELSAEEALLTAHHADDQLETVLLALVRGAGPRGLGASPAVQAFGAGWLMRPLLAFNRSELEGWAIQEGLAWIVDPTNESTSFDRNYLRHEVVTKLRARWPAAARSAVRSAELLQESALLIDELAELDMRSIERRGGLAVERLNALSAPRRRNVLRYWLRAQGLRAPSARRLAAIDHDMRNAQRDRIPCSKVEGAEIRRHRDVLYCVPVLPPVPQAPMIWEISKSLALPPGLGALRFEPSIGSGLSSARLPQALHVMFRRGGETLKAAGEVHRRSLKKRLQDANILPWWRGRLPLIYAGDRLVAVGDLWVNADDCAREGEAGLRVVWDDRPAIHAIED